MLIMLLVLILVGVTGIVACYKMTDSIFATVLYAIYVILIIIIFSLSVLIS